MEDLTKNAQRRDRFLAAVKEPYSARLVKPAAPTSKNTSLTTLLTDHAFWSLPSELPECKPSFTLPAVFGEVRCPLSSMDA